MLNLIVQCACALLWQALVTVNATAALERAGAADAATRRGESWGPLHGVPFAAPVTIPDPDTCLREPSSRI